MHRGPHGIIGPLLSCWFTVPGARVHAGTMPCKPGTTRVGEISANDRIPPQIEAVMEQRMQPRKTITLQASHAFLAQGAAIVSLIEAASTALI